jgi:fatty-acid desaturase
MTTSSSADHPAPRRGGIEWANLDWKVITAIGLVHLLSIPALFPIFFSWSGLIIFFVMIWVSGGLGINLCYHRLLTHRSFKTPKWFEYFLTFCGCLAWQGGPINWVGVHRLHHRHADTDQDPHSPKHGFEWSHILWTLHKKIEGISGPDAARDLARDPKMLVINQWFFYPQFVLIAAFLGIGWAIGGWTLGVSWVIWGVTLRTTILFHGTWFVNSAAHTWGYQNYPDTGEHSTNLWWVALISFGEGWHNNHHAHPRSAAHGLRWYEFDATWWMIRVLSWIGLASDVHLPAPEQMPGSPQQTASHEGDVVRAQ